LDVDGSGWGLFNIVGDGGVNGGWSLLDGGGVNNNWSNINWLSNWNIDNNWSWLRCINWLRSNINWCWNINNWSDINWLRCNVNWLRCWSSAFLLASWLNDSSAGSSNEGDDVGASCVCESSAVCAVSSGSWAVSCAFLCRLVSASKVCNGVRSASVKGLSIAIASFWNISWLKSLSSCSALSLNDSSAPGSDEGCNVGASCDSECSAV